MALLADSGTFSLTIEEFCGVDDDLYVVSGEELLAVTTPRQASVALAVSSLADTNTTSSDAAWSLPPVSDETGMVSEETEKLLTMERRWGWR